MSIIALAIIRWLKLCRFLSVHSPKLQMLSFLSQSVLIFVEFKLHVGGAITLNLACTLWGNDSANIVSSCHFCSSLSYKCWFFRWKIVPALIVTLWIAQFQLDFR